MISFSVIGKIGRVSSCLGVGSGQERGMVPQNVLIPVMAASRMQ